MSHLDLARCYILGFTLAGMLIFFLSCWRLGRLAHEWHHAYLGMILVALGVVLARHLGWWPLGVALFGLWLVLDDAVLHAGQALYWHPGDRQLTGADDETGSLLHRLAHHLGLI